MPTVRYGTSSWSEKSWVGPFYPAGCQPSDFRGGSLASGCSSTSLVHGDQLEASVLSNFASREEFLSTGPKVRAYEAPCCEVSAASPNHEGRGHESIGDAVCVRRGARVAGLRRCKGSGGWRPCARQGRLRESPNLHGQRPLRNVLEAHMEELGR